ncbi:MAG: NAD-dependent epimerase/dehydratase family protein [Usitatibacter sp.]
MPISAMTGAVIVTGASGFVGRSLMRVLEANVTALHLAPLQWIDAAHAAPFEGATVFHLAARAHQMHGASEADYTHDNVEKSRVLTDIAARRGARRVVFLSTLKVNGEESCGRPFTATDEPAPRNAYARSKLAAEEAIAGVAARHGLETTIVRAPLVYGEGARGNLHALLRLADSPWPLPFAALDNRRSFIHVDDLAVLLLACSERGEAAGRTYLAAHREPASTQALIVALRAALGRSRRLFPVAPSALEVAASTCGQGERMRRLTRSLEADPSAAERDLGWCAKKTLAHAVADLVRGYRELPA